jgi:muramoyltetrapeptide carboxypeptidase
VLFVEDIGTKPYQWDRMLQHLRFAGMMEHVRGVVLGDMSASVPEGDVGQIEASCLHALKEFGGPVAIGLRCGHVESRNRSVPLGAWVSMDDAELKAQ